MTELQGSQLLVYLVPALSVGFVAQAWIWIVFRSARMLDAGQSGFSAARQILDANGLSEIAIEQTPGFLSDHYDSTSATLRLSGDVFHGRNIAAVAISIHEAGHAMQHVGQSSLVTLRNLAVAAAQFGSTAGILLAGIRGHHRV